MVEFFRISVTYISFLINAGSNLFSLFFLNFDSKCGILTTAILRCHRYDRCANTYDS